jgi:DNA-binding response OmpR family regulator
MKILLVEDDADMSRALSRALEKRGFQVTPCGDGTQALKLIRDEVAELVILDLNIPGLDGLHILQRSRAQGIDTPVIVLTARGAVGDRVAGLNAGADDYLAKPFDLEELEARIHALLRRKGGGAEEAQQKCGQLRYERSSGAFYHGEQALEFTPREQALLKALMVRPGHAVNRERLLQVVFPDDANVQVEAIEVVIHRLRKKLVVTQTEIMTLRGLGYLLRPQAARAA